MPSPQECAPGYYRDTKGLFLGRCIPCQCHGHSDLCIPGLGTCMVSGTLEGATRDLWVSGLGRAPSRVRVGTGAPTISTDLSLRQDCQHNTEGDHCERCQAGFVRIGTEDPAAPCVSCPCPVSVPSNK